MDTLQAALDEEINPLTPRGLVLVREIEVIERIQQRYFDIHPPHNLPVGNIHLLPPDKDLGPLGEEIVFLREIQEVIRIGLGANVVEWVSQAVSQTPYDIKSKKDAWWTCRRFLYRS
ncbi:hypothetical protein SAMN05421863_103216 [Nitrosomonas communis]|uniref:Uncharacterized protein n=2 Tax=Nitrosomonas communis TaxID=44574 RepID=A0A1I4RD84_9PROT|nr:hypothetical protein SAMN05421863_103216 [Nitrosomonas communis]